MITQMRVFGLKLVSLLVSAGENFLLLYQEKEVVTADKAQEYRQAYCDSVTNATKYDIDARILAAAKQGLYRTAIPLKYNIIRAYGFSSRRTEFIEHVKTIYEARGFKVNYCTVEDVCLGKGNDCLVISWN